MKKLIMLVLFVGAIVESFAVPTVSNLKVTPLPPWGIAIDYDLSGADDAFRDWIPFATSVVNGTTNVAHTLVGDTTCTKGPHRVYWNMAADGISAKMTNGVVSVRYEWPTYCVIDLSDGAEATKYDVSYCHTPPRGGWTNEVYKTTKLVLKRVEAGSFIMGDDQTDASHRVTLTKPFYMGLFEVTQKQWELVTGSNPCPSTSYGKVDAYPVFYVSYNMIRGSSTGAEWPLSNAVDADSFLGKLRKKTGNLLFDLPTEAQWEYACRAGTTTTYSYGNSADGAYMWYYYDNSSSKAHLFGTKLPNKWGFYDMHGNVWEWCLDWWGSLAYGTDPKGSSSGSSRVLRGGSWGSNASRCTSSYRYYDYPSYSDDYRGFRLSRTLPAAAGQAEAAGAAFVSGVNVDVLAEDSAVDGELALSYLPYGTTNAVVMAGETELIRAQNAGSMMWQPLLLSKGPQTLTHTVGDVTLSATYTWTNLVNGFMITYENLKGATHTNPTQYRKGAEYTFSDPLPKTGYTFLGWTPNAITADMASNVTVTANWRTHRYRIVYDANGGEGSLPAVDCLYDEAVTLGAKGVSREGYALLGWSMSVDGPLVYEVGENVTNLTAEDDGEVVLYAVWEVLPPKVSNLSVTPLPPWGLAIDYEVNGVAGENTNCVPVITVIANGVTNVAQTLAGRTTSENGAHRVYWNMAADGISAKMANATVSVRYEWSETYCVVDLSGGASATRYSFSYCHVPPSGGWTNEVYKTTKLVLKRVDAGLFIMGNDQANEAHRVTLTQPFYMGLFEVTQKQWQQVMGSNPCSSTSYGKGDACPVHYVSYNMIRGSSTGAKWPLTNAVDADSFLGKLRAKTGNLLFDLPTEAQWEYACRAGMITTYSYGDSADGAYMWYCDNSSGKAHEVGTKLPNEWGFYDMHGNVWEWCLDWYGTLAKGSSSGSYRVGRGGGWYYDASSCTSSYQGISLPSSSGSSGGFRLSRTLPAVAGQAEAAGTASVSGVNVDVLADGGLVEEPIEIGYASDGEQAAVVTLNGLVAEFAHSSGSFSWLPSSSGLYVLSHIIGTNVLTMTVMISEGSTDEAYWTFPEDTDLTAVTLPTDMTSIPNGMFDGCSLLTSLEIPAGVTNIGARAFRGMTSLTSLVVPDGVTRIGEDAFTECTSLSSLTLPSGCTFEGGSTGLANLTCVILNGPVLGVNTLRDLFPDALLQSVTLGEGWTAIPKSFFTGSEGLAAVTCSENVTMIGEGAFDGCSALKTLEIPAGVTNIGARAFRGMTSLTSLVVPDGVTRIGEDAFAGCTSLASLTLPAGCAHDDVYAGLSKLTHLVLGAPAEGLNAVRDLFPDAPLESVDLGEGWTVVPTGFFDGCTNLVALSLADSVSDLGDNDFREMGARAGKNGLWIQDGWVMGYIGTAPAEVEIPDGVKGIAAHAFEEQYALSSVSFPTSLVSIGMSAFRRCTNLERIDLPEGVARVDDGAFQDCTYAQVLTAPSTLRRVGRAAFANTASLGKAAFAAGLDEIGEGAFSNAWRIISVSIPASVTNIGENAFWNCKNLTGVTTPTHLQPLATLFPAAYAKLASVSIAAGESALVPGVFAGCAALELVALPEAVTNIPDAAFEGCAALRAVALPAAVTNVGARAFAQCAALARLDFPEGLRSLGAEACAGLPLLEEVALPAGLETVGANVFADCAAVRAVTLPGGLCALADILPDAYAEVTSVTIATNTTTLAERFLDGCAALTALEIPAAVTNLGARAFAGCAGITALDLPDGLRTIGAEACRGMATLTEIEILGGVTGIGKDAFADCAALRRVTMPGGVCRVRDAFSTGYASLVEVNVTPDTTQLVDGFFEGCAALTEVGIPNGVTALGTGVFRDCAGLLKVALPDGLTTLPDETFAGCSSLASVVVPASVTTVGADVFSGCTALKSARFLGDAPSMAAGAYAGAAADLVTYVADGTVGWDGIAMSRALPETWPSDASNAITTWTPKRMTVTFDAQGGAPATTNIVQTADTTYRLPQPDPTREGATFAGWWSEVEAGAQVKPTTRVVLTSDHAFYAHWRFHEYEIAFNANGGDGEMKAMVRTFGDGAQALPQAAFTRVDYAFAGWATEPEGEIAFADGAEVENLSAEDGAVVTLYAVWTARTWTAADYLGTGEGVVFSDAGERPWTPDRGTTKDGNGAMRSGAIGAAAEAGGTRATTLTATVIGEGEVSFWWRTSCEPADEEGTFFDYVSFSVDGEMVAQRAGETDWERVTCAVAGAGSHVLTWTFMRDDYDEDETLYDNAAWVDAFTWARSPVVVSFDLGGVEGEAPAAVTNVAGYALTLPDVSALGGTAKRFVGWSDGAAVYAAGATYVFGGNATLIAQWEEKTWTLADAVDAAETGLVFTMGGDTEWVVDFATNKVGGASARSGTITHGQTTWLETTVTGAGELRFWMKVCGERYRNKDCDVGTCVVDGTTVYTTATNDWTNVVVPVVGDGAHTIRWAYTKNASRTAAYDCAWVDGVTWQVAQPEAVVITPTDGGASFEISDEWFEKYYPNASASERQAIAEGAGGKIDASGAAMPVWHDYVAGTDPTNATSRFTAKVEMKDGAPVVTWSPALNGEGVREGARVYRVWGKANLGDAAWSEVSAGGEGDYRFFRVTVEMP